MIVIAYALTHKVYKKLIMLTVLMAIIFTIFNYALPYLNLPEKVDPSQRLKGWKELGLKVSDIKKRA